MPASVSLPEKPCTVCGESKPLDEFYPRPDSTDGLMHRCKGCDNSRPRQTPARQLAVRARQRAVAELVKIHADQFTAYRETLPRHQAATALTHDYPTQYAALRSKHQALVEAEANRLATAASAAEGHTVLLKPGPAARGQTIVDRVTVQG